MSDVKILTNPVTVWTESDWTKVTNCKTGTSIVTLIDHDTKDTTDEKYYSNSIEIEDIVKNGDEITTYIHVRSNFMSGIPVSLTDDEWENAHRPSGLGGGQGCIIGRLYDFNLLYNCKTGAITNQYVELKTIETTVNCTERGHIEYKGYEGDNLWSISGYFYTCDRSDYSTYFPAALLNGGTISDINDQCECKKAKFEGKDWGVWLDEEKDKYDLEDQKNMCSGGVWGGTYFWDGVLGNNDNPRLDYFTVGDRDNGGVRPASDYGCKWTRETGGVHHFGLYADEPHEECFVSGTLMNYWYCPPPPKDTSKSSMPWKNKKELENKYKDIFKQKNSNGSPLHVYRKIPYVFSKWHGKRYILYKNLRHDGTKLLNFTPFSILAPQKTTGNLPAPEIIPFKTPTWDVSNGYLNMPKESKERTIKYIEFNGFREWQGRGGMGYTTTYNTSNTLQPSTLYTLEITNAQLSGYNNIYSGTFEIFINNRNITTCFPNSKKTVEFTLPASASQIQITDLASAYNYSKYSFDIKVTSLSTEYWDDDTQGTWCTGGNVFYDIPNNLIFNNLKVKGNLPSLTVSGISQPFNLLMEVNTYKEFKKNTKTGKPYRSYKAMFNDFSPLMWSNDIKVHDKTILNIKYPRKQIFSIPIENRMDIPVYMSSMTTNNGISGFFNFDAPSGVLVPSNSTINIPLTSYNWSNVNLNRASTDTLFTTISVGTSAIVYQSKLKTEYIGYIVKKTSNLPNSSVINVDNEQAADIWIAQAERQRRLRATGRI